MNYLAHTKKKNGHYKCKFVNALNGKYCYGLPLTQIESLFITQLKVEKRLAQRAPNLPEQLKHLTNLNKIRERYEPLVSAQVFEASLDSQSF
jgi:hypothetical protein